MIRTAICTVFILTILIPIRLMAEEERADFLDEEIVLAFLQGERSPPEAGSEPVEEMLEDRLLADIAGQGVLSGHAGKPEAASSRIKLWDEADRQPMQFNNSSGVSNNQQNMLSIGGR